MLLQLAVIPGCHSVVYPGRQWMEGIVERRKHFTRTHLLIYPPSLYNVRDAFIERGQTPSQLLHPLSVALKATIRIIELSIHLGPILVKIFIYRDERRYAAIKRGLERSGGAFIKLGQWAATRPDILPADLCLQLSSLQSSAPAHPLSHTLRILSKYPELAAVVIERTDDGLLGSGTIGQVHRGVWRDRRVAIKALHPDIHEHIGIDMFLLECVGRVLHRCIPGMRQFGISGELNEFKRMLKEQLDLRFEGHTLMRFARNFKQSRNVHFPEMLFSQEDVLIEMEERGIPMQKFIAHVKNHKVRRQVAEIGLRSFVKMLLWDNFVHADLHPGNMLVRIRQGDHILTSIADMDQNATDYDPQLVFLDTGLVTELTARDHDNFVALFRALVMDGDGEEAGRLIATRIPQPHIHDPAGFARRVGQIAAPVLRSRFRFDHGLSLGPLLVDMMASVREHGVCLDPAFTNLIWSMVCVEGIGRQLAPDLPLQPVILKAALQFVFTTAARAVANTVDNTVNTN